MAYRKHARTYYGWASNPKRGDKVSLKSALRLLRKSYGDTLARDFGPLSLKACRATMIRKGWARTYINSQVDRIRRMFRWAAEEELLPGSVHENLVKLTRLRKGKCDARESERVRPVPDHIVEETLHFLQAAPRSMVQLQWLTGMRPGEVCSMRGIDIDKGADVWIYRPGSDRGPEGNHKTAHHGHERTVLMGPRAQEIVKQWLKPNPVAYLFSPREAEDMRNAARRENRKSAITPSHAARTARRSKRTRGVRYEVAA